MCKRCLFEYVVLFVCGVTHVVIADPAEQLDGGGDAVGQGRALVAGVRLARLARGLARQLAGLAGQARQRVAGRGHGPADRAGPRSLYGRRAPRHLPRYDGAPVVRERLEFTSIVYLFKTTESERLDVIYTDSENKTKIM